MTNDEFVQVLRDACAECELHASYTLGKRAFATTQFTLQAVLLGVKERLESPARTSGRRVAGEKP